MTHSGAVYVASYQAGDPVGEIQLTVVVDGTSAATISTETLVRYNNNSMVINNSRIAGYLTGLVWQGWSWRRRTGFDPEVQLLLQVRQATWTPVACAGSSVECATRRQHMVEGEQ